MPLTQPHDLTTPRQRPARYGLGGYLAFAFSLLSILVTAVLVGVSERIASEQVRSRIGSNLAELAKQTTSQLDRAMYERHREVGLMAQRLAQVTDPAHIRGELDALQQTYPNYAWIGVADPAGKVLASTNGVLTGADVSARPWFRNAYLGQTVGDVHGALLLDKLLPRYAPNEPMRFVDIAFQVPRAGRKPDILGVHLAWQWAADLQKSIFTTLDQSRTVEPLIVAADGMVLLGPQGVQGTRVDLPSLHAAGGESGGFVSERWPDGVRYLVGYSHDHGHGGYPGLGWRVLVRQELDDADEPVQRLQLHLAAWGLGVALLFSLLGWLAARMVTRPLKELGLAARVLESGGNRPALQVEPYREVAQLGAALDSLLRKLQQKEAALLDLNASLERRVEERTAALHQTFLHARENEQRIHTILESAPDPFIGMDFQGRITDWNTPATGLFGWRQEDVLGRPMVDVLIPARFRPSFDQALQQFRATGELPFAARTIERLVVDRNGREIQVEMRVGVIQTGSLELLCAFMHDVSARKAVERLKSEFVSTVSHELRTPLTAVYGSLRLLATGLGGNLPAQGRQLLEMSTRSCERLIRLINDVLDVERIESGRMELRPERLNLRPLLERALHDTQPVADGLGVPLQLDAARDAWVMADADRMIQVVVNLVSNAAKFSPRGEPVRITLGVHGHNARVGVLDRGPGIPPEFRSRVFERFAQADASDRREKGGTGLGLNICRSIVQAHGGTIGFDSEVGVRTEFYFELPLAGEVQAAHADEQGG